MQDEVTRSKITKTECIEMIALKDKWLKDPDQKTNGIVYKELTSRIKEIIWDR